MAPLTNEMSHEDVATLRDADAEQVNEHNDVGTVGSRSQCLVANLINKIGDNPSRAIAVSEVERIAKANPDSVVIVDEAYVAFEENYESAVSLIGKYNNICVIRTLSKAFSLAGIRLGYAVGSEELIEGLKRARDSFNSYPVDRLAQTVAEAALLDVDYYNETRSKIIATRKRVAKELAGIGFKMPPSSANFLYAKPPVDCGTLYQNLRNKGILVRYFNKPVLNEYLRITIGTDDEMKALIEAIKEEVKNAENS